MSRLRLFAALPLVAICLALVGCSALDAAIRVANAAGDVAEAAHAALAESYEAEQHEAAQSGPDAAAGRVAVAEVRARFAPAWRAYRVLRAAWVAAAAIIRAAQVDGALAAKALALVAGLAAQQAALADALAALGGPSVTASPPPEPPAGHLQTTGGAP